MKRITAFFLVLILLFSFAACGEKEDSTGATGNGGSGSIQGGNTTQPDDAATSGDEEIGDAVHIKTPEDLVAFAERVNNGEVTLNAVLDADIDLSSVCGKDIASWNPIGYSGRVSYDGVFDGKNHTIRGLYISPEEDGEEPGSGGLFWNLAENSIIRNLILEDVALENQHVGSFANDLSGRLENCHASGTVSGLQVGGLVYASNNDTSVITNCSFSGTVTGTADAGGLVWFAGRIEQCRNEATVICISQKLSSIEGDAGGIAVRAMGDVIGCSNEGTVIAVNAAGIVAYVNYDTSEPTEIRIEDCINTGNITGRTQAGGIGVYFGKETTVNRCGNEGSLTAGVDAGGIAVVSKLEIVNSYSRAAIAAGPDTINTTFDALGFSEYATVDGEYADNSHAAGIACEGNRIVNCYSQGSISAQHVRSHYGDALGILELVGSGNQLVANCYTTADLSADNQELGIGIVYESPMESCFYSEQTADRANKSESNDFGPTSAGSFTDGTVTDALNQWVQAADGDYSTWKQGPNGPCFDWE